MVTPVESSASLSVDDVYRILNDVMDPEVPVISVVELGIVRDVSVQHAVARGASPGGDTVHVVVTPTYSGCPAMREIEDDIRSALLNHGVGTVTMETVFSPPWTTDWIGPDAREKLRAYGIAPPGKAEPQGLVTLTRAGTVETIPCPLCGSSNTRLQSEFGSTACKAIHVCHACLQPFDAFKAF